MDEPSSLKPVQRKLEEKAKALLASPAGYTVEELIPVLRAALAGELDDKKFNWSKVIRSANNPMALFASKYINIEGNHSAFAFWQRAWCGAGTTARNGAPYGRNRDHGNGTGTHRRWHEG
jgi:hypothetical protein